MRPLPIAVLGATGAVGRTLLEVLSEGELPVESVRALASERSAGSEVEWAGDPLRVEAVKDGVFRGADLAFLATPAAVSKAWAAKARAEGALVLDLSRAFRVEPDVPLAVAGLNDGTLAAPPPRGIVAVPGAPAAHLAVALAPLRAAFGLLRVQVTTLEAVSAAGHGGVEQLEAELRAMLSFQEPPAPTSLTHRAAFNVVPQAGAFGPSGASEEELGLAVELARVLGPPFLRVAATVVRVPVFHGHLHALTLATERPAKAEEVREVLRKAKGVKVLDAPGEGIYPMPMLAVTDEAVLVGRIREDPTVERGLSMLAVGDNLRQGAAVNAVRVAKLLAERHLAAKLA
ncbi:MAG: aspartate-semialdehyde dehydrogenase [Anaeromyxobacteraceae bacterium]